MSRAPQGEPVQMVVGVGHYEGLAWVHLLDYLFAARERVHRWAIRGQQIANRGGDAAVVENG